MPRSILLIEDDREIQRYLQGLFSPEGWRLVLAKDGGAALKILLQQPVDAAVLDISALGMAGFKIADQIRAQNGGRELPMVMITGGYRGASHRAEAIRRYGLLDYMDKPVQGQRLVMMLKRAFAGRTAAHVERMAAESSRPSHASHGRPSSVLPDSSVSLDDDDEEFEDRETDAGARRPQRADPEDAKTKRGSSRLRQPQQTRAPQTLAPSELPASTLPPTHIPRNPITPVTPVTTATPRAPAAPKFAATSTSSFTAPLPTAPTPRAPAASRPAPAPAPAPATPTTAPTAATAAPTTAPPVSERVTRREEAITRPSESGTLVENERREAERLADEAQKREKREVEQATRELGAAEGAILRGNVRRMPFPRLLHRLYLRRASGALFLLRDKIKKIVFFREGHPIHIKSNRLGECLGRVLVRERLISERECEESLRRMKGEKRHQGAVLIGMRVISPHNLKYGLELQLQIKLFDVFGWTDAEYRFRNDVQIPPNVISLEMSNAEIILDGIRRTYDRGRLENALAPYLGAYVHISPDPAIRFQEMGIDHEDRALIEAIDGQRTLRQCLAESASDLERAMATAYAMLCAGVLEVENKPARKRTTAVVALAPDETDVTGSDADTIDGAVPEEGLSREQLAASLLEMRRQDHFNVLGIARSATDLEIERAYARRAQEFHPDRFRDRGTDTREFAAQIFGRLAEAHRVLTDPLARKRYGDGAHDKVDRTDPVGRVLAADIYFRAGEDLFREQRFSEAAAAFRRATELSPEGAEYRAYLGWSMFQHNADARESAISELEQAIRLNPKLDRAYLFLGYIYQDMGRRKPAETQFEKAIQCNPDCLEALAELRELYSDDDTGPTAPRDSQRSA